MERNPDQHKHHYSENKRDYTSSDAFTFLFRKVNQYLPLLVVIAIALGMAYAHRYEQHQITTMNGFMGYFFCILAMLKLFNIVQFADGFQKYDLIGKQVRAYAYTYPCAELFLGLCYIGSFIPLMTNVITLVLMSISALGIIIATIKKLDVRCACLGTVLNVPLSTVSLLENIIMAIMALINITHLIK